MGDTFRYTVIKSRRRSLAIHIQADGKLIVRAPEYISDREIEKFLVHHTEWIEKRLQKVNGTSKQREKNEYYYLGKSVFLTPGTHTSISVEEDMLHFPQGILFRRNKELTNWYIGEAKRIITSQTVQFAKEMGVTYKEITFSDTRSQWGRCTHDNRLQFSWRLVMAPILVLNYVVVHELAHTLEKNHTHRFWAVVRKYNPSYKTQMRWLKSYGGTLTIQ